MSDSEMEFQRDQALACMVMVFCITLAVFLSVFGRGDSLSIAGANVAVTVHEGLLRDSRIVLHQNQDALLAARGSLENMKIGHRR
jgi:hypothetical protein